MRTTETYTPLLATKVFIPPVRPELVSRPRLIERLNEGMDRKLTLVSAPAGYGKTTLLSEWIHQDGDGGTQALPVAWLSLDEGDNDPTRFLSYLVGAAQTIVPHLGEGLLGALQSSQPPPSETILTSLINELAAIPQDCSRCCLLGLVLDDYHLIESQEIHNAIAFLLDHLPPPPEGAHLIIATRKDPLLPLPRWRAGAHMTEIREADLRFTHEEATAFLTQAMGLALSTDDVAILEARTEGWIAGLQLAALSMQGLDAARTAGFISAFSGDDRHIVDYLIDEVLAQRPRGTKDFLLKTSVLERMSGSLCDFVTGGEDGQNVLEMLEQANLFVVALDNRRQWYRYHHLFADLLRNRLRAMVGTGGLLSLHLRASEWYDHNGYAEDAVHHAFAAGDLERAADLIEQNARDTFARSELRTLMNWVDALPEDLVQVRPWLCVFYAWALRLTGGGAEDVETRLQVAELALRNTRTILPKDQVRALEGHIAGIQAYQSLYREDIPRALSLSREALDRLPEATFARGLTAMALGWASRFSGDLTGASQAFVEAATASLASGNTYAAVASTCRLAYTQMLAGQLGQAVKTCGEALQMAAGMEGRHLPVAGYALVYLGLVRREWNHLEEAARHLADGIDLCRQVGYMFDQVVGYSTLARVLHAKGDWDGARRAFQNAEQSSQRMKGYVFARRWVEDCQVRLWSAQDRVSSITGWIQETDLRLDDQINFGRELEHIILARAFLAMGREQAREPYLDEALDLLARLLELAESAGWMGKAIEILVLQALAHQERGDTSQALSALKRALSIGEPEGYVRTFVDEGPPMARLLLESAERGIAADYARRLLAAFATETKDKEPALTVQSPERSEGEAERLIEPLSKRELEVLQLVARGFTNKEIASRLFLAPSTVKVHTRNIYGKLGVHNRTQAVTLARDLGLL
ncbi:MAG TPA: LuxR C-terminal-related transcriptional regulator [Anaerolineae bacterium]|nr:LuxR C-terminal-related transcriptional regulator [Anaerolineae bacterium]